MTDDALDRVAERMASLSTSERLALVRLFGALYEKRDLPSSDLCAALRDIGTLDDEGMLWLAGWFQENVNLWGAVVGDPAARARVRFSKRKSLSAIDKELEPFKAKAR